MLIKTFTMLELWCMLIKTVAMLELWCMLIKTVTMLELNHSSNIVTVLINIHQQLYHCNSFN
jgi:hypothetical protein